MNPPHSPVNLCLVIVHEIQQTIICLNPISYLLEIKMCLWMLADYPTSVCDGGLAAGSWAAGLCSCQVIMPPLWFNIAISVFLSFSFALWTDFHLILKWWAKSCIKYSSQPWCMMALMQPDVLPWWKQWAGGNEFINKIENWSFATQATYLHTLGAWKLSILYAFCSPLNDLFFW